MALDDPISAIERIQDFFKDDIDKMANLSAALTFIGECEFAALRKVWVKFLDSPAEKAYLERVLPGSAAGLGVESTTGSGAPAAPQNAATGVTSGGAAAGLGVGSAAGAGATVGPALDSEAAGGEWLAGCR
ncbi:hypothetical protein Vretifemale_8945 [Volvox reticuliferus]|uniref:Uncharacterized protein n=1 Tax=Volvox reticuliferus TaxID=1737510 RepID=A0A8J4FM65_9CHLO|nr:hypothetical protein Vretifemale_8945 [Volvox reticuliferus]